MMAENVLHNYRKVRKEGGARVLALTPFIPADWKIVRINQYGIDSEADEGAIYLRIEKVA